MKMYFHLCMSFHDGVLFRHKEDYWYFENCVALTVFRTGSELFVDSVMSNHVHMSVITNDIRRFSHSILVRYTRYYNRKYSGDLHIRDISIFYLELSGERHVLTAWSYILRNGKHHGLCRLPFAYEHSTVSHIFNGDYGRHDTGHKITSRSEISSYLPRRSEFPDGYYMDSNGMFARESISQIKQVEFLYSTPARFDYYMNRKTCKEWEEEQNQDNNGIAPVTLKTIEDKAVATTFETMIKNEYGNARTEVNDEYVCELIDGTYLRKYGKSSIHLLSIEDRQKIATSLHYDHNIPYTKANRCLWI